MTVLKSIVLFVFAAIAEIGGAWLIWQAVREDKAWWWAGLGIVALGLYGFVAAFQPDGTPGRITRLALSVNLGFDDPSISALTRSLTFSSDIWQSSPKWTDRVKGFGPEMKRKSKVSETVQKQEEKWRWAQGFQDRWQL